MSEIFNRSKYKFSQRRSIKVVENEIDVKKKKEAISFFYKELRLYKVNLADLCSNIPSDEIRNVIFNIACFIVENEELMEAFFRKRDLPYRGIVKETFESKSFLDKWSDYIKFYVVMLSRPDYKIIKDYLQIAAIESVGDTEIALIKDEKKMATGLALAKNKRYTIILTSDGKVQKLKLPDSNIGYEVTGIKARGVKYYSKFIIPAASVLIIAIIAWIAISSSVTTTVVVSCTSDIKIDINRFSKVVNLTSETKRGKRLIADIDYESQSVDSLLNILALDIIKEEMVPQSPNKLLIVVSGKPLEEKDFILMKETLNDKNIQVNVNNAGTEVEFKSDKKGKDSN